MYFLQILNNQIIKQDLINKYRYRNNIDLPKLTKITLNFTCVNFNIQKFATTFLALELITSKKGSMVISNSPNILLKIQKGQFINCQVILRKKHLFKFLEKLLVEILPKLTNFSGFSIQVSTPTVLLKLPSEKIVLPELKNQYPLFETLPILNICLTTTARKTEELLFLIKTIKIPIRAIKTKYY